MIDTGGIGAFLGLDVGRGEHHATAVTPAGKKAFDKRLPHSEPRLRGVFSKLQAKHGTVLVVVDQPASIGTLPLAVARDMGCPVACLPGLTMRRIADLHPGGATLVGNRLRGLPARIHPHPERVLGPRIRHPAVLTMPGRFRSPARICRAGRRQPVTLIRPKAPRTAERLVGNILNAPDEQTVASPARTLPR